MMTMQVVTTSMKLPHEVITKLLDQRKKLVHLILCNDYFSANTNRSVTSCINILLVHDAHFVGVKVTFLKAPAKECPFFRLYR